MKSRWTQVGASLFAALALAAGTAACGDDGGNEAAKPPPPASPEDFPAADGRSLRDILREVGAKGPVMAASVSELDRGRNRFGFGLFDRTRAQISDAPTALYFAPVGGGPAFGPYVAHYESLKVDAPFQSTSVTSDPDAARSLYVANVEFPKAGRYEVLGVARLDDRLVAATPASGAVTIRKDGQVPDVGEKAPVVHTETKADVAGNLEKIDTRVPPSTMHDDDFADVVGRKPVVLLFATPALCASRVCGPVVDIAEQIKARRGDEAAFIHQEIFANNDQDDGLRPQVAAWRLVTEPWLFTIDRRGRIAARLEGAFSAQELDAAIDAAVKG